MKYNWDRVRGIIYRISQHKDHILDTDKCVQVQNGYIRLYFRENKISNGQVCVVLTILAPLSVLQ